MEGSFATILFAELVGTTPLFERKGDELADEVRREHLGALRGAVDEHGGREVKSTGEGLMIAFSSAVAAVRCAAEMQRATAAIGTLELSVGLDAGEPLPEGEDFYGTPVIVASRLCDASAAGEILASETVCRIAGPRLTERTHPVGALRLRGISERVAASRVAWREPTARSRPLSRTSRHSGRSRSWWPTTSASFAPAFE